MAGRKPIFGPSGERADRTAHACSGAPCALCAVLFGAWTIRKGPDFSPGRRLLSVRRTEAVKWAQGAQPAAMAGNPGDTSQLGSVF